MKIVCYQIVTMKDVLVRKSETMPCGNFISATFSYEEIIHAVTRSLTKTDGNMAEIRKELVSFQIYDFQSNSYHFCLPACLLACLLVCLFVCLLIVCLFVCLLIVCLFVC